MKRILIGSLLSAVALFLWGFVYWNVLPFRNSIYQSVPTEASVLPQLSAAIPHSGVYLLPNVANTPNEAELNKLYSAGPIAEIIFLKHGAEPFSPYMFVHGFLHMFIAAFLMGILLSLALPALATYMDRVKAVVIAGLAGSFFAHLGDPIWFHHPWNMHILHFVYDLTCWILVGLILSRFVRN